MFKLSEKIQSDLSQAIAHLRVCHLDESSNTRADLAFELGGLPIYMDMGGAVVLFSSGELLTLSHDVEKLLPTESPLDIVSLVVGAERFPWLQELLPERAISAKDCSVCESIGRMPMGSGNNVLNPTCGTCFGLGWVNDS